MYLEEIKGIKSLQLELEKLEEEKERLEEEFEQEAVRHAYAREMGKPYKPHIDVNSDEWRMNRLRVDRDYEDLKSTISESWAELEGKYFEWVLGQTEDPEPDIGYQTPELWHAVAERAYELADTLDEEEADVLREYADEWAEATSRDVYGY